MMTVAKEKNKIPFTRKLVIPLIAGGLAGFLASIGVTSFMDGWFGDDVSVSRTIAAVVGVLYMVIAIGVGVGAASPALGDKYLNTEDADEILEMRNMLMTSGAAMALFGAALILLAMAAPEGPIAARFALIGSAALFVVGGWLGWRSHKASDELFTAVNLEATAWAYAGTVIIGGGWAVGAHLGFAAPFAPLDWVTMFYIVALASSFIASGRRGMLKLK